MKTFPMFISLILVGLFLFSCGTKQVETDLPAGLDVKSGMYSYRSEDKEVSVIVDYEVARLRKEENYFPLDIMIANKKLPAVTVTRDSLILIDANGKTYSMASIQEIQDKYQKLWADSQYRDSSAYTDTQSLTSFTQYQVQRSNFFPEAAGGARVTNRVIIRPRGYIDDRVYFPMPETGIEKQKLILRLVAPELESSFDVVFTVN
ncbi:hypothetical protein ACFLT2_12670 [Acidobacteriota bacterium]